MATITTLLNFDFADGEQPVGSLVEDAAGDLFGTASTPFTDTTRSESVFEIAKTPGGYASAPTILATFDDNSFLSSGLTLDTAGDLFAQTNGADDSTDVYEIANVARAYQAPARLANVAGAPSGSLVIDPTGDLVGATVPTRGSGVVVYELAASGSGFTSSPTTIASIPPSSDGGLLTGGPSSSIVATDADGDLIVAYGQNFSTGYGSVDYTYIDEIQKLSSGYADTAQLLGDFALQYGELSNLQVDGAGDVLAGMSGFYYSSVAEIARGDDDYAGGVTVLTSNLPPQEQGSLAEDSQGDLFVATQAGTFGGDGAVTELTPSSGGGDTLQQLVAFDVSDGENPNGLLIGPGGALYGTTEGGGAYGGGTLFRIDLQPFPSVSITDVSVAFFGELTISGTIDAGDASLPIAIYDGDDLLGEATPDASGDWSASFSQATPSGENDLEAVATTRRAARGRRP